MPTLPQKLGASQNQIHAAMSKTSKLRSKSVFCAHSTSAESPTHVLCSGTRAGYTSRRTRDRKSRHRRTVAILFTFATLLALLVIGIVTYQVAQGRKAKQLRNSTQAITTPTDNTDGTMPGQDQTPNIDPLPYVPDNASPNEKPIGDGVEPNNTRDDSVDQTPVESSYMGVPRKLWSYLGRYKMNVGLALGAMVVAAAGYKYMVQPAHSAGVATPCPGRVPKYQNTDDPYCAGDRPAENQNITLHDNTICPHKLSLAGTKTACIPGPDSPWAVNTEWLREAYNEQEIPYVPNIVPYKPGPAYSLEKAPRKRIIVDGVEKSDIKHWQAQIVVGEVWPINSAPGEWVKPDIEPKGGWVGGDVTQRFKAHRFCKMWRKRSRDTILTTDRDLSEYYVHYPTAHFEPDWRYGGTNRVKYAGTSTFVNHLDDWVWGNYEYYGKPIAPSKFVGAITDFAKRYNWATRVTYTNGSTNIDSPQCSANDKCGGRDDQIDHIARDGECRVWPHQPVLTFEIFHIPPLPKNTTLTPLKNGRPWKCY